MRVLNLKQLGSVRSEVTSVEMKALVNNVKIVNETIVDEAEILEYKNG